MRKHKFIAYLSQTLRAKPEVPGCQYASYYRHSNVSYDKRGRSPILSASKCIGYQSEPKRNFLKLLPLQDP